MPATIARIGPFQTKDPRPRLMSDQLGRSLYPGTCRSDDFVGFVGPVRHFAQLAKIVKDLLERVGRKPDDFGFGGERLQGTGDFIAGGRTNPAKSLGENMAGSEPFQ